VRYDPKVHHRHSIRLKGYDYSWAGAYFITACTHEREMVLDMPAVAWAAQDVWLGIPVRFPSVALDEFVVMPNHVHGVIFLVRDVGGGGASPAPTLADVICAFKSVSAIAGNKALGRSGRPFWQRNYYERVIRNEDELNDIRQYIRDNPKNWDKDPNNPEHP
jgi:REP element-mobilizing transposase RayT